MHKEETEKIELVAGETGDLDSACSSLPLEVSGGEDDDAPGSSGAACAHDSTNASEEDVERSENGERRGAGRSGALYEQTRRGHRAAGSAHKEYVEADVEPIGLLNRLKHFLRTVRELAVAFFTSEGFKVRMVLVLIVLVGGGLTTAFGTHYKLPASGTSSGPTALCLGALATWAGSPDSAYALLGVPSESEQSRTVAESIIEKFVRDAGERDRPFSAIMIGSRICSVGDKPELGLSFAKKVIERYPRGHVARSIYAVCLADTNRFEEALSELDKCDELGKNTKDSLIPATTIVSRLQILAACGKWNEVLKIADDVPEESARYYKALALLKLNRFREARLFCTASCRGPRPLDASEFKYLAGRAAILEGKDKLAEASAGELDALSPDYGAWDEGKFLAKLLRSDIALSKSRFSDALHHLEAAEKTASYKTSRALLKKLFLLNKMGAHDRAAEVAKRLHLRPGSFILHSELYAVEAETLFFKGEYRAALEKAKQSIRINPNVWLSYEIAVKSAQKLGLSEEAHRFGASSGKIEQAFLCGD